MQNQGIITKLTHGMDTTVVPFSIEFEVHNDSELWNKILEGSDFVGFKDKYEKSLISEIESKDYKYQPIVDAAQRNMDLLKSGKLRMKVSMEIKSSLK